MIGGYLDAATDEERDRVIMAQRWVQFGASYCVRYDSMLSPGCLVQHATGGSMIMTAFGVAMRFDTLVARFGMGRVVRAIKQRAGKWTRPEVLASCDVRENAHALQSGGTRK